MPARSLLAGLATGIVALLATGAPARAAGHAPVCTSHSQSAHMGTPVTVPLKCTDADGDRLKLTVLPPLLGRVDDLVDRGDGTGSARYAPPPALTGITSFTYVASDGLLVSAPAKVSFYFDDHPPTCTPLTGATHHLRPVTIQLRCADPDGDALTYAIMRPADPEKGTVGTPDAAGRVTFVPNPAFSGTAHFRYKATDGAGSDGAEVQIAVRNGLPTCRTPGRAVVANDRPSTLSVTCSDPDGDPLTLATDSPPAYGTLGPVTRSGGTFSFAYTPQPGYVGDDRVLVRVSDGSPRGPEVTVPLTVTSPGGAVDTSVHSDASDILDRVKLGHMRFRHGRLRMRTLHGVGAGSRLIVTLTHRGRTFGRHTIRVKHGPTRVSLRLKRAGRRYVARHRVARVRLSLTLVSPGGGRVNDWRLLRLVRHGKRYAVR